MLITLLIVILNFIVEYFFENGKIPIYQDYNNNYFTALYALMNRRNWITLYQATFC